MEFLVGAVVSGIVYDMLKHSVSIQAENLKERLKGWILDEAATKKLVAELESLDLTDELSESAIEKRINNSPKLLELISSIKKESVVININQNHSGTGDNVARDKITK